jgi:NTE family protein
MRTTEVLMGRVREEMLNSVYKDNKHKVAFMHLNDGLDVMQKYPRDSKCPTQVDPEPKKDIAGKLSRVRTDLDSFTDVEATCLMARGYTLGKTHLDEINRDWNPDSKVVTGEWFFTQAIPWLTDPQQGPARLARQLDVAEQKLGKVLRLGFSLDMLFSLAVFLVLIAAYVGAIYFIIEYFRPGFFVGIWDWLKAVTFLEVVIAILLAAAGYFLEWLGKVFKVLRYFRKPYQIVVGLLIRFILPALGAIPVRIYLATLDKYYVRQGRLMT